MQKILGIEKAGHSGTLDPGVTGVLPIATGRATRVVQMLLTAGKEYVCIMHIHKQVDEALMRKELMSLVGVIEQMPPVKSAVKRQLRKEMSIMLIFLMLTDRMFYSEWDARQALM